MAKAKSLTPVEFEVEVKNRKPYKVTADSWRLGDFNSSLVFSLRGQLVFTVAAQKWDYVERITPVPEKAGE
jgi:hypothetical protein